jgi:hypothetical protein
MTEATGYAIRDAGEIDVRTVSPTPRAAKVNWLVTGFNARITNATTDEQIEAAWLQFSSMSPIECVRVAIKEIADA